MIADKVIIHGKSINIHTYPRTIGGVQYMYYRARLPKGNGDYLPIQATSIEEVKNQIYFQYNVHAFTPGYNSLDITIGDALPVWIDVKYSGGRPGTYIRNKGQMKNHILPHLAKVKVRELKQADVQQSMDFLSRKLAPSTVHSICSLLCMFMQDYVDRHEIPYNPVMVLQNTGMKYYKSFFSPLPKIWKSKKSLFLKLTKCTKTWKQMEYLLIIFAQGMWSYTASGSMLYLVVIYQRVQQNTPA